MVMMIVVDRQRMQRPQLGPVNHDDRLLPLSHWDYQVRRVPVHHPMIRRVSDVPWLSLYLIVLTFLGKLCFKMPLAQPVKVDDKR